MSNPKILAFETSCDDTSVAVVDTSYKVWSNIISSQTAHARWGGVVPEIASRLHMKNIMPLTRLALTEAGVSLADISAIAVSVNPGLIGALLVGLSFAKGLAWSCNLPLIAVNHMLAHVAANKIEHPNLAPPYLALVVSGGHTELVHFASETDFTICGRTVDDAAGEAFDKAAKLLGLGYPGGPLLDKAAKGGDPDFYRFPRAMDVKGNYDFSFSGLKTAVRQYLEKLPQQTIATHAADIAASVQAAIVDILAKKTVACARKLNVNKVIVAGGVSANSRLRQVLAKRCQNHNIELNIPSIVYCTDNAAMVGVAAIEKFNKKQFASLEQNAFSDKGTKLIR